MIRIMLFLVAGGFLLRAGAPVSTHAELAIGPQEVTANQTIDAPSGSGPVAQFLFDGTIDDAAGASVMRNAGGAVSFERGLDGMALSLGPDDSSTFLSLNSETLPLDSHQDFSVQFWVRTVADTDKRFVVLSQKEFFDNSLASQKKPGWVFYVSDGTWAWNMGSSARRITYERDNGKYMPLNDGRWHQLTITYDSARSVVRLFYDGDNKASYNVTDSDGFSFRNTNPVVVGWDGTGVGQQPETLPAIEAGAKKLQELVDTFNGFGLDELESDEFVHLIVDPRRLFDQKVDDKVEQLGAEGVAFREAMAEVDWEPISVLETALMSNPYTVHQVLNFMETAPLMKVYALVDGQVAIKRRAAKTFAERERLHPPEFDMDDLAIWARVLSPEEVLASYSEHFVPTVADLEEELTSLTAGCWNIWHGGKHYTASEHGWDSRGAIAEILKRENADVVMMQETYSSGDFIAAEMDYYFATTVDRDYLNQGSNISVLSRYPIKELSFKKTHPS